MLAYREDRLVARAARGLKPGFTTGEPGFAEDYFDLAVTPMDSM